MDAQSIAEMIATWLHDRDDIASARIIEGDVATVGVETQGGETYFVEVTAP